MRKILPLLAGFLCFALQAHTQENARKFVLHVTHVKSDYIGDKPTDKDCTKVHCTTMIVTVEGHSATTDYVLECREWILRTEPVQQGKCWALESSQDYFVRRWGSAVLFYEDSQDTNPVFLVTDERERKTK